MQNPKKPRPLASDGLDAIAKSLSTLITGSQFRTINDLSDRANIKRSEISQKLFDCEQDELSISGADDVIAQLRELQPEGNRNNILPFAITEKKKVESEEVKSEKDIPHWLWELQYMAKANMPIYIGRLENDWWKDDEFLVEGIEKGWIEIVPEDGFLITEKGKEIVRSHDLDMTPDNPPEYYIEMTKEYKEQQIRWAKEEESERKRLSKQNDSSKNKNRR